MKSLCWYKKWLFPLVRSLFCRGLISELGSCLILVSALLFNNCQTKVLCSDLVWRCHQFLKQPPKERGLCALSSLLLLVSGSSMGLVAEYLYRGDLSYWHSSGFDQLLQQTCLFLLSVSLCGSIHTTHFLLLKNGCRLRADFKWWFFISAVTVLSLETCWRQIVYYAVQMRFCIICLFSSLYLRGLSNV